MVALTTFQPGATCYLAGADRVRAYHVSYSDGARYWLFRDGRMFPVQKNDPRLRTGFEEDFPTLDLVDWGSLERPFTEISPDDEGMEWEAAKAETERFEAAQAWCYEPTPEQDIDPETPLQQLALFVSAA